MPIPAGAGHTASEFVYEQLRRKIFEKSLTSGQRLPEVAIAKEMNVSRTPVREALRRLESEGLVQIVPGWGACLASPTKQEIIDTYEVRETLEIMAIRKAARRITPLQICMLQEQINAEREIFIKKDLESYLKVNDDFHIIIAESSGNSTLAGYVRNILSRTFVQMIFFDYVRNILSRTFVQMIFFESFFDFDTNPSLEEHITILEALKAHDEEKCAELISEHLRLSMEGLKAN